MMVAVYRVLLVISLLITIAELGVRTFKKLAPRLCENQKTSKTPTALHAAVTLRVVDYSKLSIESLLLCFKNCLCVEIY